METCFFHQNVARLSLWDEQPCLCSSWGMAHFTFNLTFAVTLSRYVSKLDSENAAWARQVQGLHDDAPMPGRHCSTVSDSTLDTSLWDCVMTASLFGCQPSTDSSATSTGYIVWSGVRCRRSVHLELTAETFTRPFQQCFCFLAVFLKRFSSLRVLMYTAYYRLWRGCAI